MVLFIGIFYNNLMDQIFYNIYKSVVKIENLNSLYMIIIFNSYTYLVQI